MTGAETSSSRLRALLRGDGVVHLPGVHDAVTARLAAAAGVRGACLSGAVASAVALGLPDIGFVHGEQIAARAREVVPSLGGLPLLADADTGYGNALQARATTRTYAAAGIAGLHLEDQLAPKRCGHMSGKTVVGVAEAAGRVRAAVEAGTGLVVVARTDALPVEGLDSVIARCRAFVTAGADALFVEGTSHGAEGHEVLTKVRDAVGDEIPFVVNHSEAAGPQPNPDDAALANLGVRVVIHPVSALLAVARAVSDVYAAISRTGSADGVQRWDWDELTTLLGLPEQLVLADRYDTEGAR